MDRISYLFRQYISKTATSAERLEFQEMLGRDEYDEQLKSLIDLHFANFQAKEEAESLLPPGDDLLKTILSSRDGEITEEQRPVFKRLWRRIAVAASLILTAGIGLYIYKQANDVKNNTAVVSAQDIAPGGNGATLTLANGKKIRLTDAKNGELVREAGLTITKTADGNLVYEIKEKASDAGKTNSLSTEKGETYQLRLPDGSLVWLNSASSLTYTTSLNENGRRVVRLNGEAYFEIAKDKAHPFVVKTNDQEVQVLGTHFNVMAYKDEQLIRTTLLEGSVNVLSKNSKVLLKPGEQALNDTEADKITVASVDTDEAISWKNGYFNFDNETIGSIMKQISRWYDVDVEYKDADQTRLYWVANYPRSGNLKGLLKSIELTGGAHFKIEGRKILVTR